MARRPRAAAAHGGSATGRGTGGPDPLAPPYDVRAALDEIGQDVLAGGSLREALRELMRRGRTAGAGSTSCRTRIRRMRARARRRGDLGGTLDQVRAALDQALAAEREQLAGDDGDDARLAEMDARHAARRRRGRRARAGGLRLALDEARATYEADPADAPAGGAGRAVRRDEAGAVGRRPGGDAAGQGHAGRPQRPARGACAGRGHRRPLRASSWTSTASSSRSSRRTSTS